MNKEIMLRTKGEGNNSIHVQYRATWTLGDEDLSIGDTGIAFYTDEQYSNLIEIPIEGINAKYDVVEGSFEIPNTHIYGYVFGGSNAHIDFDESEGIEYIHSGSTPKFKVLNNNIYISINYDSGF